MNLQCATCQEFLDDYERHDHKQDCDALFLCDDCECIISDTFPQPRVFSFENCLFDEMFITAYLAWCPDIVEFERPLADINQAIKQYNPSIRASIFLENCFQMPSHIKCKNCHSNGYILLCNEDCGRCMECKVACSVCGGIV